MSTLTDHEFTYFRHLMRESVGLALSEDKKTLVSSRLAKRLRARGLTNYTEYLRLVKDDTQEFQRMVDLLTTHTTSFFREAEHFAYLGREYLAHLAPDVRVRVWCAACSTGEEAYCLGMVLQDRLGAGRWELIASDVSEPALDTARTGLYPLERTREIPAYYLKRFALRGRASQPAEGFFTFSDEIKAPISFRAVNLQESWHFQERFDIIFLRNVMIYFDQSTRHDLVRRMLAVLKPDGLMFSGHSESLFGISPKLRGVRPAVYRLAGGNPEDRAA